MVLVLVLFALIIAMGCGALACRWLMADTGEARHVAIASVREAEAHSIN